MEASKTKQFVIAMSLREFGENYEIIGAAVMEKINEGSITTRRQASEAKLALHEDELAQVDFQKKSAPITQVARVFFPTYS